MLKTKNLELLCDSIPEKIAEFELNDTNITNWGDILCSNFKDLFKKYAICHKMINSSKTFSTSDIDQLETAIDDLLSFFRETFPDQSITPKLHLLEDHVVPFLRRWSIGFGLYGEQGMEALHIPRLMICWTCSSQCLIKMLSWNHYWERALCQSESFSKGS
eukprot:TCONS_00043802-protein